MTAQKFAPGDVVRDRDRHEWQIIGCKPSEYGIWLVSNVKLRGGVGDVGWVSEDHLTLIRRAATGIPEDLANVLREWDRRMSKTSTSGMDRELIAAIREHLPPEPTPREIVESHMANAPPDVRAAWEQHEREKKNAT